jgi:hypothetical protein
VNEPAPSDGKSLGRLMIRLDGAIRELDFTTEAERDQFIEDLGESLPDRLRQMAATWRANRYDQQDLIRAREIERQRVGKAP